MTIVRAMWRRGWCGRQFKGQGRCSVLDGRSRRFAVIPAKAGIRTFALIRGWRAEAVGHPPDSISPLRHALTQGMAHSSLSSVGRIPDTLCLRRRWCTTSLTATVRGCRAVVVPSGGGHIRVWVESSEGQGGTRELRCDRGHGACPRGVRRPKVPPLPCRSRSKDMDSRLRGNDEIRPAAMRRERPSSATGSACLWTQRPASRVLRIAKPRSLRTDSRWAQARGH